MSKYKQGDRFILEIEQVQTKDIYHEWREPSNHDIYFIKGFRTLVFDDYGLEQLTQVPDNAEILTLEQIFQDFGEDVEEDMETEMFLDGVSRLVCNNCKNNKYWIGRAGLHGYENYCPCCGKKFEVV